MTDGPARELRSRFHEIERHLDAAADPDGRDALKRDIIALFKEVDAAITELGQLKTDIRGLVERYKQAAGPAAAPPVTPAPPVAIATSPQADHLGASTFIEKGWGLISLGDYAGAMGVLERALALAPDSTQARTLLGWAEMLSHRYDDALATFSAVLAREPTHALARVNVGYICLQKGIFGEAIEHLTNVIRLDSDRKATLYANYYLGLLYLQREMYDDAATFFHKALRLGPNLIEAYFDLGRAQWLGGHRAEALHAWEQGHRANRFNPWAKRCKAMAETAAAGGDVPRGVLS